MDRDDAYRALEDERNDTKADLAEAEAAIEDMNDKTKDANQAVHNLRAELKAVEAADDRQRQRAKEAELVCHQLRAELAEAQRDAADWEEKALEHENDFDDECGTNRELRDEKAGTVDMDYRTALDERDAAFEESAELRAEFEQCQGERNEVSAKWGDALEAIKRVSAKLDDARATIKDITRQNGEIIAVSMDQEAQEDRLNATIETLTEERDAILLQAKFWASEAKTQRHTVNEIGSILGGVPDWGPIADGVRAKLNAVARLTAIEDVALGLMQHLNESLGCPLCGVENGEHEPGAWCQELWDALNADRPDRIAKRMALLLGS